MSMPKAAIYENNCLKLRQHNIRISGQFIIIKPISEPMFEEEFSNLQFRFSVGLPNLRHCIAPLFFIHLSKLGLVAVRWRIAALGQVGPVQGFVRLTMCRNVC